MFGRKNIEFQGYVDRLEHRLTANAEKMEQRFNVSIAQTNANIVQTEQRLADDAKEREQRLNENIIQVEQRLTTSIAQTNANVAQIGQRVDKLVEETKTTHRWLIGVIVTSLLSAAGVAVAVVTLLINGSGM